MGLTVNLEVYFHIRPRQPVKGFFYQGKLVLFQVFRGKCVRHADDKFIVLIADAGRLAEPGER